MIKKKRINKDKEEEKNYSYLFILLDSLLNKFLIYTIL